MSNNYSLFYFISSFLHVFQFPMNNNKQAEYVVDAVKEAIRRDKLEQETVFLADLNPPITQSIPQASHLRFILSSPCLSCIRSGNLRTSMCLLSPVIFDNSSDVFLGCFLTAAKACKHWVSAWLVIGSVFLELGLKSMESS